MTMCDAEAVRELAAALYQPCQLVAEDTGISGGLAFICPGGGEAERTEFHTTLPCWVARIGVDGHEFKDHVAAMIYLRVLGVRDET